MAYEKCAMATAALDPTVTIRAATSGTVSTSQEELLKRENTVKSGGGAVSNPTPLQGVMMYFWFPPFFCAWFSCILVLLKTHQSFYGTKTGMYIRSGLVLFSVLATTQRNVGEIHIIIFYCRPGGGFLCKLCAVVARNESTLLGFSSAI